MNQKYSPSDYQSKHCPVQGTNDSRYRPPSHTVLEDKEASSVLFDDWRRKA